jgi:hypothetical protein
MFRDAHRMPERATGRRPVPLQRRTGYATATQLLRL